MSEEKTELNLASYLEHFLRTGKTIEVDYLGLFKVSDTGLLYQEPKFLGDYTLRAIYPATLHLIPQQYDGRHGIWVPNPCSIPDSCEIITTEKDIIVVKIHEANDMKSAILWQLTLY